MFLKLLFIAIIVTGIIIYFKRKWAPKEPTIIDRPTPISWYKAAPALFTPAEQLFLSSLETALHGVPVKIFGKVRIADILKVRPGLAKIDYQGAFSKISAKHVDFVLVNPLTTAPLLIIELDDSTHEAHHRKVRDAFVDEAMYQAQIPILHVPLRQRYDENNLRAQIVEILRQSNEYRHQAL